MPSDMQHMYHVIKDQFCIWLYVCG